MGWLPPLGSGDPQVGEETVEGIENCPNNGSCLIVFDNCRSDQHPLGRVGDQDYLGHSDMAAPEQRNIHRTYRKGRGRVDPLTESVDCRLSDLARPGRGRGGSTRSAFVNAVVPAEADNHLRPRAIEGLTDVDESRSQTSVEVTVGELDYGDDSPVDVLPEEGMAERLDVAHQLFWWFVLPGEDVDLRDHTVGTDDTDRFDSFDPANLLLESDSVHKRRVPVLRAVT